MLMGVAELATAGGQQWKCSLKNTRMHVCIRLAEEPSKSPRLGCPEQAADKADTWALHQKQQPSLSESCLPTRKVISAVLVGVCT